MRWMVASAVATRVHHCPAWSSWGIQETAGGREFELAEDIHRFSRHLPDFGRCGSRSPTAKQTLLNDRIWPGAVYDDRPIPTRCSPLGRRRRTSAFKGLVVSPSGVAAWTCHCASPRKANDLGEQVQTENEAKRHSDGWKATSGSLPQAALG